MTSKCSLKHGYFSASVIMVLYMLRVIPASSSSVDADSSHHGFIAFASAPDKVVDGSTVTLHYHCPRPCQLGVRVLATTLQETNLVIFRRTWLIRAPGGIRTHQVLLRLPPSILYRGSLHNREVLEVVNVTLGAWIQHKHGIVRVSKQLQITPVSERPSRPPTECPSWPSQLMWRINTLRITRCQQEAVEMNLLEFPLASTGEGFGAVRRVWPLIDADLERLRRRAVTKPRAALSMWIYLVQWCQEAQCSIFHHLNNDEMFDSPLIQLSDTGDLIIQAHLTNGEEEAFRTNVALPLWTWTRLDFYMEGTKVEVKTTWDSQFYVSRYEFQNNIHLDDTDGHFVIGGSRYARSIRGYYGPVKYYRFGTNKISHELNPRDVLMGLSEFHTECEELKDITRIYQEEVRASHFLSPVKQGVSKPHFIHIWSQFAEKTCKHRWTWESQKKHTAFFHFLGTMEEQIPKGYLSFKDLRSGLFDEGLGAMFIGDQVEINMTEKSRALLHSASCFGNHKASLLLASLHLSGLGHAVDQPKGHIYSLIGALGDDRFALMHAGYKHTQGIDGFSKDFDMAYSYYSNMAIQNNIDMEKIHQNTQYLLEHIYLWKPEDLAQREVAGKDVVDFLKYQAERGDVESQKHLGAMLYWGQNGLPKDLAGGLQWLERSALQMKDPDSMYHYSILLIKGQGVKRNYTQAVDLLNKAAEMGSINALNGLGWYHGIILNDHTSAVKYFEQAVFNGSKEAMFNLAVYHLSGTIPDQPQRNETAAFLHFLNASALGHVGASVEAAHYLSTGSLKGVSQDAKRAVRMLKKVCEQNGHLGFMIREALQAYLRGSWQEAFVKYVLAAETGLGLAQSNVAHLCEEWDLGYDCQWRYQNYSILNYDPHPSALLKMGDYLLASWSFGLGSLSALVQAVWLYSRAALMGSPQAMFNLFILMQQGHSLPSRVQEFFNVSRQDEPDIVMEKILTRCVESEGEGVVEPCALALLWVQMGRALRSMSQSPPQHVLVCASFLSLCVIIVSVPLKMCLDQKHPSARVVAQRARTSSVSQDGINTNTAEQNGIMGGGGPYIPADSLRISVQKGAQWLSRTCDLALTLAGLCLCAFWTTLLYHLP
ncbi:protein sel-1 homolog 3 [Periophthalmus magnuspinnatus]|uniref:protein sel-1 homolog 3 n=1 Tax=Periophthalmus magnuspinnatus TaxID=409849 RepID=UPI002437150E|nr:protein sel-1 homolog 3 [Periophthalmus magnuspinnatus]